MKFADKTAIRSKIMISPLGIESQTFPLWLFLYWPVTLVMASQERRRFWMARSSAWMSAGILDSMDCTLVTKSGTDSCAASDIPITVDISNVKYHCRARVSDWLCLSPAVLLQGKIASWVPSRGMTHHSFPQKQPAHILAAGRSIICGMVKPFIQPVRRRRGNPNWGRPLPPAPAVATEFDQGAYGHLGAKPKHGKSCISRSESVCVAKGTPFLGRNVQQGEVLLCSLEDPRQHVDNCLQ